VISVEEIDFKLQDFDGHKRELLSKSRSIHTLDKIAIDPELLSPIKGGRRRSSVSFDKERARKVIKFIEYAPRLFNQLRKKYGISGTLLQDSFDPSKNKAAAFEAGESQGKSGSFFFFTHDKRFLIKTIGNSEYTTFMKFLPEYYRHCFTRLDSLIARIYGIYKIQMSSLSSVYFYLMENVLRIDNDRSLITIFDLKGSKINRDVNEAGKGPKSVLKDENYLRKKDQVILQS